MKKIYHKLKISLLALLIIIGVSGCEINDGVDLDVRVFTVDVSDWSWNQNYQRYECMFLFDEITEYIYNEGFINAQVYISEVNRNGNYETLKPLPFVQTYLTATRTTYTETISYDVSPGSILFSIQSSDLTDNSQWLNTYSFKVSIMK